MIDLNELERTGFTIVENFLTSDELRIAKHEALKLKRWFNIYKKDGQLKDFGTGQYWKGIEMAGVLSKPLMELYTSEKQYRLATEILGTDEIYLFNDEVVVKNPHEPFDFLIHTDNEFGPDPDAALRGDYRSVNICWMLDNITEQNGPISFLNKETDEWETPYPKEGDVVVFDGNTVHSSSYNVSDSVRRCWATVYTTKNIGYFFNNIKWPLEHFKGFYTERFTI